MTTPALLKNMLADPFIEPLFLRYIAGISGYPIKGKDTPPTIIEDQLRYLADLNHDATVIAGTYNQTGLKKINMDPYSLHFYLSGCENVLDLNINLSKGDKRIFGYTSQRVILNSLPNALTTKLQARLETDQGLRLSDIITLDIGEDIQLPNARVISVGKLLIVANNTTISIDNEPVSWHKMKARMIAKITGEQD